MKKLIAGLLIMVIAIGAVAAFEIEWYFGGGMEMCYAKGFEDMRISDYNYKGVTYASGKEGSVMLNLNNMNRDLDYLGTAHLGCRMEAIPNVYAIGEVCIGLADEFSTYALQVDGGAVYIFPAGLLTTNLHVGVGTKVGYFSYTKFLGKAQLINDNTMQSPVWLPCGKIYDGDTINFSSEGLSITPYIDLTFDLTQHLAIGMDVGYQIAISFKNVLTATDKNDSKKKVEVDFKEYKSKAFFKPITTSGIPTECNPLVSLTGLKANAHVMYRY